jgi:hypothetical protein
MLSFLVLAFTVVRVAAVAGRGLIEVPEGQAARTAVLTGSGRGRDVRTRPAPEFDERTSIAHKRRRNDKAKTFALRSEGKIIHEKAHRRSSLRREPSGYRLWSRVPEPGQTSTARA